ncbi:MAG: peptidase M41, partial [Cyclobacteriaceae bacterium]|nr:peptidase M41 [Cyclobacteriaceae bacterium]
QSDLEKLIGKRPFSKPTTYEAYTRNLEEEEKKAPVVSDIPSENKSSTPDNGEEELEKKEKPAKVREYNKSEKSK